MVREIKVNDVYIPLLPNEDRYLVLFGGAGSGKSVFAAQKIILRLTTERNHRFLACRKYAITLKESVFKLLKKTIFEFGILDEFVINKTEKTFYHKPTGNEIICAGLDDPEKLKSIVDITGIWIEEATETDEEDFDQLDLRIRGETDNYKQIILTFNPVDERHWLKKRFDDKKPANATVVHTTYEDNHFIDEEYKSVLEQKASVNPNYYRIYKLGQWGKPDVQRAWAHNFEYERHVADTHFRPEIQLRFSFDFNVDPFVCLCLQIWNDRDGEHLHYFKEFVLKDGDVYKMAEKIKDSFPPIAIANALFTGDAMQRKREITQRNNIDAWRILAKELNISTHRMQVPSANPSVKENRHLVNAILALHSDIKFSPTMSLTLNELQFTEADEEGDIIKKDRNKMEQRFDAGDAMRYAMNTWLFNFMEKRNLSDKRK